MRIRRIVRASIGAPRAPTRSTRAGRARSRPPTAEPVARGGRSTLLPGYATQPEAPAASSSAARIWTCSVSSSPRTPSWSTGRGEIAGSGSVGVIPIGPRKPRVRMLRDRDDESVTPDDAPRSRLTADWHAIRDDGRLLLGFFKPRDRPHAIACRGCRNSATLPPSPGRSLSFFARQLSILNRQVSVRGRCDERLPAREEILALGGSLILVGCEHLDFRELGELNVLAHLDVGAAWATERVFEQCDLNVA